ncbi:alpha/beta hydrolase fold-containing protein 16 [Elsinoe australis]|uniref:Alpha/beta hydrolase fold-containing protein 16 n=1 Tax=Elsinoe australis TaxID=40998 RepID=A0A4U7B8C7_9PEZI|nr:alpha/beta hydrolase fold-containing protein 16 [Elsinoe australis]
MATTEQFPTPESVSALSKDKHPSYQVALDQAAKDEAEGKTPDFKDINVLNFVRQMRKAGTDATYGTSPAGVKESAQKIPMRDGYESEIKVYQPEKPAAGGSPLVVLIYGGGFVMGENRQLGPYGRGLVQLYNAVAVTISYRLAPEHKFPVGPNDAWDSFKWIAANAASLGADPSKGFIVGGVSAGGNLSVVVAQQAIEQNISPPITGLWLCVPIAFPNKEYVPDEFKQFYLAREENANAGILSAKTIEAFGHHAQQDEKSPWYSPMNAKAPFQKFPPSYIEVNGCDPLRDDGIIIDKILRKNGTKTRLTAWPGLPHAHFALLPDPELKKNAARDTMKGFAWLLGASEPANETIDSHIEVPASG